jgi:Tfp pilus assembly protein PilN
MIRINLLAVERKKAKKSRLVLSPAHRVTIGASLILIATVLGIGWWFMSLRETSARIDVEIGDAEQETLKLRTVLAQVQKFEARKAQLTQRVTLIEQLRRGPSAPVARPRG